MDDDYWNIVIINPNLWALFCIYDLCMMFNNMDTLYITFRFSGLCWRDVSMLKNKTFILYIYYASELLCTCTET